MFFASALNLVTSILTGFFVESPRYLFGREQFEKCRAVFNTLARKNGVNDFEMKPFHEEYDICVESATIVEGMQREPTVVSGNRMLGTERMNDG